MSVRWKPLIVLSGLFVAVALCGLVAFVLVTRQADADELLAQAREARSAGNFEEAEIYYLQASQVASSNQGAISQELADLYEAWLPQADSEKRPHLQGLRLRSLLRAADLDKTALEPRRALLVESLEGDNPSEQAQWAREVIALDPEDLEALIVLGLEAMEASPPKVTEANRILESLRKLAPDRDRTAWLEARIAQYSQENAALDRILSAVMTSSATAADHPIDRLCRLRLLVLALERAPSTTDQERVLALISEQAETILGGKEVEAARVVEIHRLSRRVRDALVRLDAEGGEARWQPIAQVIDRGFEAALQAGQGSALWLSQAYAEHLNLKGDRAGCLRVIEAALTPDVVKDASLQEDVLRMRETAIKAALSGSDDPGRFDRAKPHIEALIAGPRPEYQGLGHLFQGALDLERSGLTGPREANGGGGAPNSALIDARTHLREATLKLPNVVLAKALYGIALMMSGEPALGRQHLLEAQRAEEARPGILEPRYQVWAAWSLLEADYPEEADRIVSRLSRAVEQDPSLASLSGTIRLLQGEIARSRRSPKDLELARAAYTSAIVDGGEVPPAVSLRLAELAIELDGAEAGLGQLDDLRRNGGGSPALEALAVSTLMDLDRLEEAGETLDRARQQYPADPQLAVLSAAILVKQENPQAADEVLAAFLAEHPEEVAVAQTRARILAGPLERPDEARTVLVEAAERSGVTAPFVQLAMLDLAQGDQKAAAETVATIRRRWPEAASADLLDAQLCLARRDFPGASRFLQHALQKDPSNKVALFWKAQLDSRSGSPAKAAEVLKALLEGDPVKELGDGLSLSTAAEWSLAALSMEHKDFDDAIARLESIAQDDRAGALGRAARWKLIAARSRKGQWQDARKELIALLNEPESTIDERVQAADLFRANGEEEVAEKLLDQVLDRVPAHSGAVVAKAFLLGERDQEAEAVTLLRSAIDQAEQPPAVYLLLAALASKGDASHEAIAEIRTTLEEGLQAHPESTDLVRTIYELIRRSEGVDAALAFAEDRADSETTEGDRFRRLLAEFYIREERFEEAESLISKLLEANPKDALLAEGLIGVVSSQAILASRRDDRERERELNARTLKLVQQFREEFPDNLRFPQAECELAMRQGDYAKAEAVARQIEQINPDSPVGPLLKAQIYRDQGLIERAVQAYREAIDQNDHRDDIRLVLGQLLLETGRADEAIVEAGRILDRSPSQPDALLLRASALVAQTGTDRQKAERQEEAIALLRRAIEANPSYARAHLELARIEHDRGNTPQAIALLKTAREAMPEEGSVLSALIRYLVEPSADGSADGEAGVQEALRIAQEAGEGDKTGSPSLAIALGFHRGGRSDLAQPWAEQAASLIESPLVYITYGDILLSAAESLGDSASSRSLLQEAVAMYDKVLALDAKSIEAINNKAWILHRYLDQDQQALELAEGLLGRVERRTLPGEFFDTLGSIQEAVGRTHDAEESFAEGLRKSPDLAVLNFHMGRLIAGDPERSARASRYLSRAWELRDQLSREEVDELQTLLDRVGG
ncbi:tetratricopeptide repeat protein [Tautonia sociabilis]|uniref:Tetratricopeptide repeat protein n=1 Tax=Tautonia sociabilis TaxID=2080755 RepID=A0A432MLV1_9BACT|nr:tetratricopeptide repeat protein [Tautonia sociabilis]RUL88404.1 tetratricopeptide repeat protein [Tautonia sociabilis]